MRLDAASAKSENEIAYLKFVVVMRAKCIGSFTVVNQRQIPTFASTAIQVTTLPANEVELMLCDEGAE